MTLMTLNRFENLQEILCDLTDKGIRYKLHKGTFRADLNATNLTPEFMEAIDVCREGLGMALARKRRLCLVCKIASARRPYTLAPDRNGRDWCEECWQKQIAWMQPAAITVVSETDVKQESENFDLCLSLI